MPRLKAAVQARKETALESLRDALRTTGRLIRPRLGCPGYGAVRVALAHWRPDFDDVPEKERLVVSLYYYEDLTMREIGATLNLSESRVCQLHSRILFRLKNQLKKHQQELLS